jgi:putative phosphoribosyl transferase
MAHSSSITRAAVPVRVELASCVLDGELAVPARPSGVILFAHGSGSSRFAADTRFLADTFDRNDLATLLIDLLSEDEEMRDERTGRLRFDISLLAGRLVGIGAWAAGMPELRRLRFGLFGASTGAAAALLAAAQQPQSFHAVVSRSGRPDLAGSALTRVMAPTLLIAAEHDKPVVALNQRATTQIRSEVRLEIVRGATPLFEEPGTLDEVATLAAHWFQTHLRRN